MHRIGFVVDKGLRAAGRLPAFDVQRHASAINNVSRACCASPLRSYVERGGLFSFNGEKISGTEPLAADMLTAGAHQMMIPQGAAYSVIGLSISALFSPEQPNMPRPYAETLDLIDRIEAKSHLLDKKLFEGLFLDLSWKGEEIVNKIAAVGFGAAGIGMLVYTFPLNSLLLRLAGTSYLASAFITWADSKADIPRSMDLLQSAMRPTFASHESHKAGEVSDVIARVRNANLRSLYLSVLPESTKRILLA